MGQFSSNIYNTKENFQINNLFLCLRKLEKEHIKHKVRKRKEIIKIGTKINEIETRKTVKHISKSKNWLLKG